MSKKELDRVKVISMLCNGSMRNSEAAAKLGICVRQIIRLKQKYAALGDAAMIHGNRNRQPKHTIKAEVRHLVLRLFQEKYPDFNFSHFTDMLNDAEGVKISRASVVRILTPREWAMVLNQYTRRVNRIDVICMNTFYDHITCF